MADDCILASNDLETFRIIAGSTVKLELLVFILGLRW